MFENIGKYGLLPVLNDESKDDIAYHLDDLFRLKEIPTLIINKGPLFEMVRNQLPEAEKEIVSFVILSIGYYKTYHV